MKTIQLSILSSLFFLLFVQPSHARQWEGAIDLNVGVPQAEFSDQLDRGGVGVGFTLGYQFENTPFMLGFDFGFMNFGVDTREEPLSSTIPDLTVRVKNSYNLLNGDIVLRAMTKEAVVRPYLEGLFGFNYFFTQTTISERFGGEDVLSDTNFDDFSMNYGFGGGAMFRVWRNMNENADPLDTNPIQSVYINVSARYLFGSEAEYLQEGSIATDNGSVTYDISRSETDLLYLKLGVGFKF